MLISSDDPVRQANDSRGPAHRWRDEHSVRPHLATAAHRKFTT